METGLSHILDVLPCVSSFTCLAHALDRHPRRRGRADADPGARDTRIAGGQRRRGFRRRKRAAHRQRCTCTAPCTRALAAAGRPRCSRC